MRIHVSVQRNHLFGKTNTQKTVAEVKNLCTEEKPYFVYLCICVSGQRNHSLSPTSHELGDALLLQRRSTLFLQEYNTLPLCKSNYLQC
jgi:hypothetical protein